jgi:hypothetical protein
MEEPYRVETMHWYVTVLPLVSDFRVYVYGYHKDWQLIEALPDPTHGCKFVSAQPPPLGDVKTAFDPTNNVFTLDAKSITGGIIVDFIMGMNCQLPGCDGLRTRAIPNAFEGSGEYTHLNDDGSINRGKIEFTDHER